MKREYVNQILLNIPEIKVILFQIRKSYKISNRNIQQIKKTKSFIDS
jgi:hypothetical protein